MEDQKELKIAQNQSLQANSQAQTNLECFQKSQINPRYKMSNAVEDAPIDLWKSECLNQVTFKAGSKWRSNGKWSI